MLPPWLGSDAVAVKVILSPLMMVSLDNGATTVTKGATGSVPVTTTVSE